MGKGTNQAMALSGLEGSPLLVHGASVELRERKR